MIQQGVPGKDKLPTSPIIHMEDLTVPKVPKVLTISRGTP